MMEQLRQMHADDLKVMNKIVSFSISGGTSQMCTVYLNNRKICRVSVTENTESGLRMIKSLNGLRTVE